MAMRTKVHVGVDSAPSTGHFLLCREQTSSIKIPTHVELSMLHLVAGIGKTAF